MVRTQVQLTEEQAARLKVLAQQEGVSVAELIRRIVDRLVSEQKRMITDEQRRRALAMVGKYASGVTDVSEDHDRYLTAIYEDVEG